MNATLKLGMLCQRISKESTVNSDSDGDDIPHPKDGQVLTIDLDMDYISILHIQEENVDDDSE
jgi:hypothetical protein